MAIIYAHVASEKELFEKIYEYNKHSIDERMNKKSNHKRMGIYSLESIECGCEIRRYAGGRTLTIGCKDHRNITEYICPTCGKKYKKSQLLKDCRWSHAN